MTIQKYHRVIIHIPIEVEISTEEATEIIAVSLYKQQRINGVQGGKIVGTHESDFHGRLEKYGQYVNYDIEDFEQDVKNMKNL